MSASSLRRANRCGAIACCGKRRRWRNWPSVRVRKLVQTAHALLAWLPELGRFNRRQIAKLVGLAPLVKQSGLWRGRVMTLGGRSRVRSALYLAALSAARCHPYYRDFYLRLLDRGKPKKLALIAVARKLLLALNQMLASSSLWENSFDAA